MQGTLPRLSFSPGFIVFFLLLSACDVPTTGPDFSFSPSVRTPVISEKTFVLMGPSETGHEALIDTTDSAFDSLFTIDETDQTIYIIQDLDNFEIGTLDEVMPGFDMSPVDVAVSIGDLAEQSFSTSFDTELGVFTLDPNDPALPPELFSELSVIPDPNGGETNVTIPNFLVPPMVDLVTLNNVSLSSVRLTDETEGFNTFTLELINDLATETITAASNPANPPSITLLQDGVEIGTGAFGFVAPGARATTRISVAGQEFTVDDLTYRLDVGTASGVTPLLTNPGAVRVKTNLEPLRYEETVVSNIPPQFDMDASRDDLTLDVDDIAFDGMVTSDGEATITVTNTLPIAIRLDALEVTNEEAVESFPAGSTILSLSGPEIAPFGSTTFTAELGNVGIGTRVSIAARGSSDGTGDTVTLRADQGLAFTFDGLVSIDRLHFVPDAETFATEGAIDLDVDDVAFTSDDDYVTLKSGTLEISDLVNGLDLSLDHVDISLADFRLPPYGPSDSLVIRFEGSFDNPEAFKYRKINRNEGPRSVSVDLSDVRIFPTDNRITYHIDATSETASSTRTLSATDEISASIGVSNAEIETVSAFIEPFSTDVTDDANGDGHLDVLDDAEAALTSLDGLDDLAQQDIDGLLFTGSEFTFNIHTNITTDLDLYAVLVGVTSDGEHVYLSGKGANAVSAADTMAAGFTAGGVPVRPEDMIRLSIEGAPVAGQTITRTVVLDGSNSNVDVFISELPQEVRYVGKALVQADGGQAVLVEPFELSASLGASIPVHIGGDFTFRDDLEADLSDLSDLTDPAKDVLVEGGTLRLMFENGIPLGLDARLDVLDALGEVTVSFPTEGNPALRLEPAPTDENGTAAGMRSGMIEISVSEDELRALSRGQTIRLVLGFETDPSAPSARLRTDDMVKLRLQGDFRFEVKVGGN